jgi:hypothetical protein
MLLHLRSDMSCDGMRISTQSTSTWKGRGGGVKPIIMREGLPAASIRGTLCLAPVSTPALLVASGRGSSYSGKAPMLDRLDRTRPRSIHLISLSRSRMDPHGPIRGLRPSGWDLRQGQVILCGRALSLMQSNAAAYPVLLPFSRHRAGSLQPQFLRISSLLSSRAKNACALEIRLRRCSCA